MTVIDDIKDRLDIVDIVSETVKLRKSGRTYIGLCPFHANTRTPSFVVWPETNTWKCFGACNTGGDVFTFVMKRDGLEFKEALRELGRKAGIEVEEHKPEAAIQDQHLTRLHEAVAAAAQWFNYLLNNNSQANVARDHLAKRSITAKTIETFQLGYSLDDWHALETQLMSGGFTREDLIDAGLLVQRDDGKVFDRFRNHLMIPIHDGQGKPIGFGARALKAGDEPKYLNSPQTALFDKGRTLYALHAARQAIRDQKVAVIVEGYMDALAAHQWGFANVVASLGTALTETQFRTLQKLAPKIVLALDPDTAGLNAMLRGLDVARETLDRESIPVFNPRGLIVHASKLNIDLRILTLPDELDPDELMQKDANQWRTLVDAAPPVVEFVIETFTANRDLNDPREKAAIAQHVLPIIRDVASPVEQDVYVQQLARKLKVEHRALFEQMQLPAPLRVRTRPRPGPTPTGPTRDATDLETYCLSLIVRQPHVLALIDAALERAEQPPLSADDFEQLPNREIFRALRAVALEHTPTLDRVRAALEPALYDQLDRLLGEPVARPPLSRGESIEQDASPTGLRLREQRLRREQQDLQALMREAQTEGQRNEVEMLTEMSTPKGVALLRLQQILSPRTINRPTAAEPWNRS